MFLFKFGVLSPTSRVTHVDNFCYLSHGVKLMSPHTHIKTYECYKPKPVTCEKWVTPLFY